MRTLTTLELAEAISKELSFELAAYRLAVAQALKLLRGNEIARAEMVLREVNDDRA